LIEIVLQKIIAIVQPGYRVPKLSDLKNINFRSREFIFPGELLDRLIVPKNVFQLTSDFLWQSHCRFVIPEALGCPLFSDTRQAWNLNRF
jgi:hypothetical protein